MKCQVCRKEILIDNFNLLFKPKDFCDSCESKVSYYYHKFQYKNIKVKQYYLLDKKYFNKYHFDFENYVRKKYYIKHLFYQKTNYNNIKLSNKKRQTIFYKHHELVQIYHFLKNIDCDNKTIKIILYEIV